MTEWYRKPHSRVAYEVGFATPAFLGDASQAAAWRTPPFKSLLRQWWRVRSARELGFDVNRLRQEEHDLFGGVHADKGSRSKVMLRLDDWSHVASVKSGDVLRIGQVTDANGKNGSDGAIYLGYGPIEQRTGKASRSALLNGSARLTLMAPTAYKTCLDEVMQLAAWFGTMGSRSRNGWGSLTVCGDTIRSLTEPTSRVLVREISRPLDNCLDDDWPTALGEDERGALLWRTKDTFTDWKKALLALASLRRKLRGQFGWTTESGIGERHILAYPVTKHIPAQWGNEARLPNQLRLKVIRAEDNGLIGMLAHFPHKLPSPLEADRALQTRVWRKAHEFLDRNARPFPGYRD